LLQSLDPGPVVVLCVLIRLGASTFAFATARDCLGGADEECPPGKRGLRWRQP